MAGHHCVLLCRAESSDTLKPAKLSLYEIQLLVASSKLSILSYLPLSGEQARFSHSADSGDFTFTASACDIAAQQCSVKNKPSCRTTVGVPQEDESRSTWFFFTSLPLNCLFLSLYSRVEKEKWWWYPWAGGARAKAIPLPLVIIDFTDIQIMFEYLWSRTKPCWYVSWPPHKLNIEHFCGTTFISVF